MTRSSPATELLPCPFCGSAKIDYIGGPGKGYRVECKGCLAQSPWGDYGIQVKTQWNTRADPPVLPDAAATPTDEYTKGYREGWNDREARIPNAAQRPTDAFIRGIREALIEKCAMIAESRQRSHRDFSVAADIAKAIRALAISSTDRGGK